jgi:positive phototaxis protein PixI
MQSGEAPITAIRQWNGLFFDPPIPPETQERLLRFPLGAQESVLLPLEQITEILRVELSEVLPIPEMPGCVMGICNWRGEMLWLVDLHHFVGYAYYYEAVGDVKGVSGFLFPGCFILLQNNSTLYQHKQRENIVFCI